MRLLPFFSKGWVINLSTSGRPALRLYSDCYRYCYFVLGCGWGRIFHFPFSASLFVCMNMRHAEYRPARRPLLNFYACWSFLFSAISFGGSGPTLSTIEYFSAISWVAVNLQSNTFQPPLWWHCRICQVAIWALHYPHQSRRTPFYLARSSEFSMSSEFLCFLRLNFQTSTGDITHAYLFKEGNTKKQRLAARGNILANKDLQHFLVLAFQHLHVLPLLFESSVIN